MTRMPRSRVWNTQALWPHATSADGSESRGSRKEAAERMAGEECRTCKDHGIAAAPAAPCCRWCRPSVTEVNFSTANVE